MSAPLPIVAARRACGARGGSGTLLLSVRPGSPAYSFVVSIGIDICLAAVSTAALPCLFSSCSQSFKDLVHASLSESECKGREFSRHGKGSGAVFFAKTGQIACFRTGFRELEGKERGVRGKIGRVHGEGNGGMGTGRGSGE